MRARSWLVFAVAVAAVAAACSSSGSSSAIADGGGGKDGGATDGGACGIPGFTGLVLCSAAPAGSSPAFCAMAMPVNGGIDGSLCEGTLGQICGSNTDDAGVNVLDWSTKSPLGGGHFDSQVRATFTSPVQLDQLGTFSATLEITQTLVNDGGQRAWKTPADACSITIAGSTCLPKIDKRVLSGSGHCSAPAAPEAGNSAAPITIGDFTFNGG